MENKVCLMNSWICLQRFLDGKYKLTNGPAKPLSTLTKKIHNERKDVLSHCVWGQRNGRREAGEQVRGMWQIKDGGQSWNFPLRLNLKGPPLESGLVPQGTHHTAVVTETGEKVIREQAKATSIHGDCSRVRIRGAGFCLLMLDAWACHAVACYSNV